MKKILMILFLLLNISSCSINKDANVSITNIKTETVETESIIDYAKRYYFIKETTLLALKMKRDDALEVVPKDPMSETKELIYWPSAFRNDLPNQKLYESMASCAVGLSGETSSDSIVEYIALDHHSDKDYIYENYLFVKDVMEHFYKCTFLITEIWNDDYYKDDIDNINKALFSGDLIIKAVCHFDEWSIMIKVTGDSIDVQYATKYALENKKAIFD